MTDQKAQVLDPDKLLGHLRAGIREWEQAKPGSREESEAAERATAAMGTLDDWLSSGGALPSAWLASLSGVGDDQRLIQRVFADMETAEGKHHALTYADIHRAFRAAFRALAHKDAELARLQAELDAYQGRTVFFAMEAHCVQIAAGSGAVAHPADITEGAILRATDTGREWERRGEHWVPRDKEAPK